MVLSKQLSTAVLCLAACHGASAQTVMLGAHVGLEASATSQTDFTALESAIGRTLAIDGDYQDWMPTSSPSGFPNLARIAWDKAAGRQIMISWRTDFSGADATAGCATAADIVAGKYDTQIAGQAAAVAGAGTDIFVRWHYEMTDNNDDTCFNNGVAVNANFQQAGKNFVASWQHIVDLFRANGATNVHWVWAPSATLFSLSNGSPDTVTWTYFYPGDSYVDWLACDRYNKSDTPSNYATDTVIANWYAQMSTRGKPLMLSETAANNDPAQNPDPETLWLTSIRTTLPAKYPAIRAMVWWDTASSDYLNANPSYGGTGYELTGPGLAAFKALANDPYFEAYAARLISSATLQPGAVAADSLVTIFGSGLASASNQTAVTVRDSAGSQQTAKLGYVAPGQINALLPPSMANGMASFTVTPPGGQPMTGYFPVATIGPGIFAANGNGAGVASAVLIIFHPDGSATSDVVFSCTAGSPCVSKPFSLGGGNNVYLSLYGTGFKNRSSLANIAVAFNKLTATPIYAGPQGQIDGLDQLNVAIPASLAGAGLVNVSLTVDGIQSNSVTIQIQ